MLTDSEYRNLSRTQQRWHALLYNVWDITKNAETARGDVDGPGLEQVGLEARQEAGKASGLCAEGAEDPKDQEPKRVEAPPRGSCGRDPAP